MSEYVPVVKLQLGFLQFILEKSKYLDNISVLPTSIFIFDKFVDGTQPEVAGEIAGTF
jgi:hypothetical protein